MRSTAQSSPGMDWRTFLARDGTSYHSMHPCHLSLAIQTSRKTGTRRTLSYSMQDTTKPTTSTPRCPLYRPTFRDLLPGLRSAFFFVWLFLLLFSFSFV